MSYSDGGFPHIRICNDDNDNPTIPIKKEFSIISFLNTTGKTFLDINTKKNKPIRHEHSVQFRNNNVELHEFKE